jgi:hypothetical protein
MIEEMRAVLDGTDPDSVLVRVRNADGVSLVTRKDYGRPIDYLRYRVKNPISDAMFMAAEFYYGDYHAISQVGSNTQATIDHLMKAVPYSAADRRMLDQEGVNGGRMRPKSETHESADPSERMLGAAFALKRIDQGLDRVQREVLRDLVIRERTIGVIAQRWKWSTDAASVMVRYALLRLVEVYEATREDFAAWLRQERQNEVEAALGI